MNLIGPTPIAAVWKTPAYGNDAPLLALGS
jgi:hypothetical protein